MVIWENLSFQRRIVWHIAQSLTHFGYV